MNNSTGSGHNHEMPVQGQLAALRARERRNVAVEVAIRAVCAFAVAGALTGSVAAAAVAGVGLGVLSARRHRVPSVDDLADRIDGARGTRGLVRTALAAEAGAAHGSPLLVEHAITRADALLRAHGTAMVRPFRLPGSALAAAAVVCVFVSVPSPLSPTASVESQPGFPATGEERARFSSPSDGADDRAQSPRAGNGLGDAGLFVANGGRSATGMEGAVGDVAGGVATPAPETAASRPADPDPCPPGVLCAPSGRRNDRASSSGGGASGRAPNGEAGRQSDARVEPRPSGSEPIDQVPLLPGTQGARGPSRADGVTGDGTSTSGDGSPEKASDPRTEPDRGPEGGQGGGINGSGGTDPGIEAQSERADVALAEERVEGLWQASAEGTVDAIEDGLAGERTSVPWRDLHAWYQAIAEEAVAKEDVPVTRRAYVQHYFDTIAPQGEGE